MIDRCSIDRYIAYSDDNRTWCASATASDATDHQQCCGRNSDATSQKPGCLPTRAPSALIVAPLSSFGADVLGGRVSRSYLG
jgi:hypothetical protein